MSKPLEKVGSNKRFVREWLKPKQDKKTKVEQKEAHIQKYLAMNKNPPVPRFPHPEPKQPEPEQKIIKKKPRVPVVPDHLRKDRSPSPYGELRKQNEDIIIHINKKPRVPKVAELLPDVKLIKPKR